jgi:mevalonate kinase
MQEIVGNNMKQGYGISHAKVILMGEHSVVYHHPAIAIPFKALSAEVMIQPTTLSTLHCDLFSGPLDHCPLILEPIVELIKALKSSFSLPEMEVNVHSNIPFSAGLGSSAALASAITKAFYDYTQTPLMDEQLFKWVQQSETLAHGNPSGVDALTTSFDCAWWFIKGQAPSALTFSIPAYLIIAQTLESGSTKEALKMVGQRIEKEGMVSINALGELTHQALEAIHHKNVLELGRLMTQAHQTLRHLGISTPTLDQCVSIALENNACGAKLTGGGLGGCMIALAMSQEDCDHISEALRKVTPHVWSKSLL